MEPGETAPESELLDQDGETVRLADLRGRNVVLYFYPKADTPGCTAQACGVRDRTADYEAADAVVLAISPDPPEKLRRFADKHRLPFTLLSDQGHSVAEAYGVWIEKSMYGRRYWGNERTTFVIGPEGRIAAVLRRVKPAEHDEHVPAELREAA